MTNRYCVRNVKTFGEYYAVETRTIKEMDLLNREKVVDHLRRCRKFQVDFTVEEDFGKGSGGAIP